MFQRRPKGDLTEAVFSMCGCAVFLTVCILVRGLLYVIAENHLWTR